MARPNKLFAVSRTPSVSARKLVRLAAVAVCCCFFVSSLCVAAAVATTTTTTPCPEALTGATGAVFPLEGATYINCRFFGSGPATPATVMLPTVLANDSPYLGLLVADSEVRFSKILWDGEGASYTNFTFVRCFFSSSYFYISGIFHTAGFLSIFDSEFSDAVKMGEIASASAGFIYISMYSSWGSIFEINVEGCSITAAYSDSARAAGADTVSFLELAYPPRISGPWRFLNNNIAFPAPIGIPNGSAAPPSPSFVLLTQGIDLGQPSSPTPAELRIEGNTVTTPGGIKGFSMVRPRNFANGNPQFTMDSTLYSILSISRNTITLSGPSASEFCLFRDFVPNVANGNAGVSTSTAYILFDGNTISASPNSDIALVTTTGWGTLGGLLSVSENTVTGFNKVLNAFFNSAAGISVCRNTVNGKLYDSGDNINPIIAGNMGSLSACAPNLVTLTSTTILTTVPTSAVATTTTATSTTTETSTTEGTTTEATTTMITDTSTFYTSTSTDAAPTDATNDTTAAPAVSSTTPATTTSGGGGYYYRPAITEGPIGPVVEGVGIATGAVTVGSAPLAGFESLLAVQLLSIFASMPCTVPGVGGDSMSFFLTPLDMGTMERYGKLVGQLIVLVVVYGAYGVVFMLLWALFRSRDRAANLLRHPRAIPLIHQLTVSGFAVECCKLLYGNEDPTPSERLVGAIGLALVLLSVAAYPLLTNLGFESADGGVAALQAMHAAASAGSNSVNNNINAQHLQLQLQLQQQQQQQQSNKKRDSAASSSGRRKKQQQQHKYNSSSSAYVDIDKGNNHVGEEEEEEEMETAYESKEEDKVVVEGGAIDKTLDNPQQQLLSFSPTNFSMTPRNEGGAQSKANDSSVNKDKTPFHPNHSAAAAAVHNSAAAAERSLNRSGVGNNSNNSANNNSNNNAMKRGGGGGGSKKSGSHNIPTHNNEEAADGHITGDPQKSSVPPPTLPQRLSAALGLFATPMDESFRPYTAEDMAAVPLAPLLCPLLAPKTYWLRPVARTSRCVHSGLTPSTSRYAVGNHLYRAVLMCLVCSVPPKGETWCSAILYVAAAICFLHAAFLLAVRCYRVPLESFAQALQSAAIGAVGIANAIDSEAVAYTAAFSMVLMAGCMLGATATLGGFLIEWRVLAPSRARAIVAEEEERRASAAAAAEAEADAAVLGSGKLSSSSRRGRGGWGASSQRHGSDATPTIAVAAPVVSAEAFAFSASYSAASKGGGGEAPTAGKRGTMGASFSTSPTPTPAGIPANNGSAFAGGSSSNNGVNGAGANMATKSPALHGSARLPPQTTLPVLSSSANGAAPPSHHNMIAGGRSLSLSHQYAAHFAAPFANLHNNNSNASGTMDNSTNTNGNANNNRRPSAVVTGVEAFGGAATSDVSPAIVPVIAIGGAPPPFGGLGSSTNNLLTVRAMGSGGEYSHDESSNTEAAGNRTNYSNANSNHPHRIATSPRTAAAQQQQPPHHLSQRLGASAATRTPRAMGGSYSPEANNGGFGGPTLMAPTSNFHIPTVSLF